MTAPRFANELTPGRRHPIVWRARRLSLVADTGQVGTLVSPSANAAIDDLGVTMTIARHRPRWEATAFGVGLRLGANAGALAEYVSWPFSLAAMDAATPMALSGIFDFVENGTSGNAGGASLAYLGAAGRVAADLYWALGSGPGAYAFTHEPGGTPVVSSAGGGAPTVGTRCQLRWTLYTDGSVQAWLSKNGAAETIGTRSAGATIQNTWSAPTLLYLNTLGATFTYGHNIFLAFAVLRGVQSRAKLLEAIA